MYTYAVIIIHNGRFRFLSSSTCSLSRILVYIILYLFIQGFRRKTANTPTKWLTVQLL